MRRALFASSGVVVTMLAVTAGSVQQPPPVPQQRPPVFRAGAHFVRVDAYPSKDGKIIEGLTKDDFEIAEDGKPQAIESFDYVTFDTWTPDAERRDPSTQQASFDLAADPRYRVFVIVIDKQSFDMVGWNVMRRPLVNFLERNLGPHDLFGLLSSKSAWNDLVLGQKLTAVEGEIENAAWWMDKRPDEQEWASMACGLDGLAALRKYEDHTYKLLEGLVALLGGIRQERKSIVFVSNGLTRAGPSSAAVGPPRMPDIPKVGITNGRIGAMPRGTSSVADTYCSSERLRLSSLDFEQRFRDLLKLSRQANVAFYPVSPAGLVAPNSLADQEAFRLTGKPLVAFDAANKRADTLITLANETDGLAIVNTNDLAGGMRRIAGDLQAYYVLGYYTTNTKWDGGLRSIKVKLKPKGQTVRARRQYRAPTQEEIAALSGASVASAPKAPRVASEVELALRALDGPLVAPPAPSALLGPPRAYRVLPGTAPQAVDVLHFARTERMRIEWTVSAPLDRRTIRLLDRTGKPLPVEVPSMENEADRVLAVELPLAAFARADYVIELEAASGTIVARSLLAFRVQ